MCIFCAHAVCYIVNPTLWTAVGAWNYNALFPQNRNANPPWYCQSTTNTDMSSFLYCLNTLPERNQLQMCIWPKAWLQYSHILCMFCLIDSTDCAIFSLFMCVLSVLWEWEPFLLAYCTNIVVWMNVNKPAYVVPRQIIVREQRCLPGLHNFCIHKDLTIRAISYK